MQTCEYCLLFSSAISRTGEEKQNTDILSSLFDDRPDSCTAPHPSQTINAHLHSSNVHFFPASRKLRLQCALVHNDKLIIIAEKEHLTLVEVYHASSHMPFTKQQFPVFSSLLFSQEIGSHSSPLNATSVMYSPVLSLLCCCSSWKKATEQSVVTLTTDVFFHQLFGFEMSLAQSTVGIVGCQNGTVFFFDIRGYCNTCSSPEPHIFSNTLCCLEQPVVAVHALHLATYITPQEEAISTTLSTAANAMVLVGRFGKLVLFTQAEEGSSTPLVTEFHVPGPVLSSFLVRDHFISFSTTAGIHRLCLEPQCIMKSDLSPSATSPIIVPQPQFSFPVKVSCAYHSFIVDVSLQAVDGKCNMTAVSIDGSVICSHIRCCRQTHTDSNIMGRDMKKCMSAINRVSEQTVTTQKGLQKVNSSLEELNETLSTLLSLQSSDGKPFTCTLSPVCEKIGLHCSAMYTEVELCYSGVATLKRGWTLLVTTQCIPNGQSKFTTLSLMGMATNGTFRYKIRLEPKPELPLSFSITASICYGTTHLQSNCIQHNMVSPQAIHSTGVSVMIAACTFDSFNFIQPYKGSPLQHTQASALTAHQGYSFDILLAQQVNTDSTLTDTAQCCKDVLRMFLPCEVTDTAEVSSDGAVHVQACHYDGSVVSFHVAYKERELQLTISEDRGSSMAEIISCIRRRETKNEAHSTEISTLQVGDFA